MSQDWIIVAAKPTMRQIARDYAEAHGVTLEALQGPSRVHALTMVRQGAMAAVRQQTAHSLPKIGQFFNRDHTTVIHAIRAVKARADGVPSRRATPRYQPVNNAARNARIIDLFVRGAPYPEIARRTGVTRGVVSGVVHRYLQALARQEAA